MTTNRSLTDDLNAAGEQEGFDSPTESVFNDAGKMILSEAQTDEGRRTEKEETKNEEAERDDE